MDGCRGCSPCLWWPPWASWAAGAVAVHLSSVAALAASCGLWCRPPWRWIVSSMAASMVASGRPLIRWGWWMGSAGRWRSGDGWRLSWRCASLLGLLAASLLGLVCWSSAGRGRLLGAPAASGAVRLSVYIIVVFRAGAGLFGALLRVCSSGWVASVANIRPSGGYCVNFSVRGCPALVNFKKKDEFNSRNLLTKRFLDGKMQNIGGVQNDR